MSRVFYLVLLVPILPLVGAFWNQVASFVCVGLAWAVFLGVLINLSEAANPHLFYAQIPLLIVVSLVSIWLGGRSKEAGPEEPSRPVDDVAAQHRALKAAVAESEKEEAQSLLIYSTEKSLAEALSWKDMAPRLTSSIQKIFGGYEFLLYALNEDGGQQKLHRRGGWSKDFPLEGEIGQTVRFIPPQESSEVVPLLFVPIFTGEDPDQKMNGFLILKVPSGNRKDEELLHIGKEFGEQLGMALDKALMFSQMENHSRTDGLTGVLRRQIFMERLDEEFKRAGVFNTPFSLLMIDIDHFKSVNDTHGHGAGDEVLKRIGSLIKKSIYETDVVGRYGGEEFIVLLPKAQRDGVIRKAEQIRQTIEAETIEFGFDKLKVTVSIGVAHFPTSARNREDLIGCADKKLYEAKETGRNRVLEG